MHEQRRSDDRQQCSRGEDLAGAEAGHGAEHPSQQLAANDHQRDDHRQRTHDPDPVHALLRQFRADCQERHDGEHRDHGEVLKQQDGKRLAPVPRGQLATLRQRLQHERRGGQACPHPNHHRCQPGLPHGRREQRDRQGAQEQLGAAQPEHGAAQDPESRGLQLQADDEEQQHHAELGEVQRVLDFAHEPKTPRPDEHAGDEIAEDGAEAKPLEERHEDDRCG